MPIQIGAADLARQRTRPALLHWCRAAHLAVVLSRGLAGRSHADCMHACRAWDPIQRGLPHSALDADAGLQRWSCTAIPVHDVLTKFTAICASGAEGTRRRAGGVAAAAHRHLLQAHGAAAAAARPARVRVPAVACFSQQGMGGAMNNGPIGSSALHGGACNWTHVCLRLCTPMPGLA
jgi:hypothetical protein